MIQLKGVVKRFEATIALRDINLFIEGGKTTVLLGTSGCGKSTILRLILGLIDADEGTVTVGGQLVSDDTISAIRHRTGYVLQEGGLFPHLTARQNVTVVARYLGWDKERIRIRVKELAELTSIPAVLLDRYPLELSGGQKQRIGLMRALMLDPDILLMDEPLGALDPITRSDLQRELAGIFENLKKTVLLVTHDLAEAAFLGEKTVLMNEGRILQQGRLEEMIENPIDSFVTRFIHAQNFDWRSNLGLKT